MADALAVTVVYPFLPFMVQSLLRFPPEEEYKIGYYAGILGGSYECGQILSSPLWGMLADRCGRRPIILTCLTLGSSFMLAFACSTGFWVALLLRFTQGLVNGTMTVGRTYMGDITDDTNDAAAFALIGILWGCGDILGPALGGLLSDPAKHYPGWYAAQPDAVRSLLTAFPFILPCALVSALGLVELIFVFFTLPESSRPHSSAPSDKEGLARESGEAPPDVSTWRLLRSHYALRLVCLISMLYGTTVGAFDQTVPVWVRDQLSLSEFELGVAMSISGLISIVASYFLITRLVTAFGTGGAMCVSLFLVGLGYITPAFDIALGLQDNLTASRAFLFATYGFKAVGCESCFTGVTLLLNRCSPPELSGTAQGIGNGFLSLGQAVGPIWGPSLFAFSAGRGGVLAGTEPFIALATLAAIAASLTRCLPPELGASEGRCGSGDLQRPMLGDEEVVS